MMEKAVKINWNIDIKLYNINLYFHNYYTEKRYITCKYKKFISSKPIKNKFLLILFRYNNIFIIDAIKIKQKNYVK